MNKRTVTCQQCGLTFQPQWSEEECDAEARANGFDPDGDDVVVVCTPCYEAIMASPSNQQAPRQ